MRLGTPRFLKIRHVSSDDPETAFDAAGLALFIIMVTMYKAAPVGFAGITIGLTPTLIHLISISVTNASVNPARAAGVGLFRGGWALHQLWVFLIDAGSRRHLRRLVYCYVWSEQPTLPDIKGTTTPIV